MMAAEPPDFAPKDALGRRACMSTPEPVSSYIRGTKKMQDPSEKEEMYKGAAGASNDFASRARTKKIIANSPTHHSCLHEVAFNRTEGPTSKGGQPPTMFDETYMERTKEKGGLRSYEVHMRANNQSKRCNQNEHTNLIHALTTRSSQAGVPEHVTQSFAGSAGIGKSIDFGSKRLTTGANEVDASDVMYGRSEKDSAFHSGMKTMKAEGDRGGVVSKDLFRGSEANTISLINGDRVANGTLKPQPQMNAANIGLGHKFWSDNSQASRRVR